MTCAWQGISAAWEEAVQAKPVGFILGHWSQGCESQKHPHEKAFWGSELSSVLRSITAQGGSEVRRGAFDSSSSPFCTVHNSLFCGPPALVASLLGQSIHAVSH